jgi:hypothetical protein
MGQKDGGGTDIIHTALNLAGIRMEVQSWDEEK